MNSHNVLIAGGGIGGLTAALCLAQLGHSVTVLEQAQEFGEAGAGIQLSPNCTRVLHNLGLEAALLKRSFIPQGTQFRHWMSGKVINENTLGEAAVERYGMPYYHIHRGDLLQVLVEAATVAPNIFLHVNAAAEDFVEHADGVTLNTSAGRFKADLLIGADGIHSVIREQLWGAEQPRFTGNIAWRCLVPTESLPKDLIRPMSTAWWGPGKHFVHYYVCGGEFVNCVCVVEKQGWEIESWTAPGDAQELRSDFAGWHQDIQQLINHADAESLFKWALFDRDPMSEWGKGRVSLLGDACHPTLPFMAQGAAMAIEDGAVLAACLSTDGDIPSSLKRYEDLRRGRTAKIQKGSRRNAKVFHLSGLKAWMRNRAIRSVGSRTVDALYSYNVLEAVTLTPYSDPNSPADPNSPIASVESDVDE